MTDAFVADVTRSIRRTLFHRLKGYGFSQDELTNIVSGATRAAVERAQVAPLVTLAGAAGPVVAALQAAAPSDPALAAFTAASAGVPGPVMDLLTPAP